ncbi:hypothetical protein GCM10022253_12150 [Sphingomonas endophytica]|mgnify:FL=1|uniref:Uncharacterized protein n=1 Tax=Sphingomonas endophytica TaxID=869719 RepID=A0A7X0JF08_9SPHN|nr:MULTISPECIES: hypothetical protein [Sphingomonas]MBB5726015.1 hypothetical protein [Sphingomonas endophytica]MBB6506004.1 hypothetical protein [Sphingomonas endophytica]VXC82228.1 conserved hypothetical protein [Sphingomonas sp. 8AM]
MTEDEQNLIRRRQKARAIVVALLLGAFVVLVFFITIARIKQGMAH